MAIPKQVLEAEETEERVNAAAVTPTPTPQPDSPEVPAKPALDLTGGGAADENDQRLRSIAGRLRTVSSERDAQVKRIAELEAIIRSKDEDLASLRKKLESLPAADTLSDDEISALTDKLNAKTGAFYTKKDVAAFATVMDMVAATRHPRRGAQEDQSGVKERLDAFEAREKEMLSRSFNKDLARRYPGFAELNNSGDPRWVRFLDTPLPPPASHLTYRDMATRALSKWDSAAFGEVVEAFARTAGIAFSPQSTVASPEAFVRPAQAAAPTPRSAAKPILPKTFCDKFMRAYNSHTLSRDFPQIAEKDVLAWVDAIEDAEEEGRIDMSR